MRGSSGLCADLIWFTAWHGPPKKSIYRRFLVPSSRSLEHGRVVSRSDEHPRTAVAKAQAAGSSQDNFDNGLSALHRRGRMMTT